MEALVARLSKLDADAEGALRVVTFYDTLVRRRVDLAALARASAGLAECVVGVRLDGNGRTIRMSPDGHPAGAACPASVSVAVTLDDEEIGSCWLERASPSASLDQLLLDRLAIAVASVVERYGPANTTMADPALVELVVSADTDAPVRDRALRLLGFPPDLPIRVVAVRSAGVLDQIARRVCPERHVKAAVIGREGVLLAQDPDPSGFPSHVRAGIGAAARPDQSWWQAHTALRFASARRPVVDFEGLGALALLAQLPPEQLQNNMDVVSIDGIADSADGLDTVEVYCAAGSLRKTADALHLHHSSVARRLESISKAMGFDVTEPKGLLRAELALTAWRLSRERETV